MAQTTDDAKVNETVPHMNALSASSLANHCVLV